MLNTAKAVARMLVQLLVEHGVGHVIASPGSRNAPLLIALERNPKIDTKVVIDERSAAFIGLGMSIGMGNKPVALCCTSGTAPLNYGPAIAEAFYRQVPLIAITADRPEEWIDQDDSQTIIQPGVFANFIKGTFDIPVESDDKNRMWMINRRINDALLLATSGTPGPVHINIRLEEPLGDIIECKDDEVRVIKQTETEDCPSNTGKELADAVERGAKIMIICGFLPQNDLSPALCKLTTNPNIVVLHEAQSNVHGHGNFIPNIDATLTLLDLNDKDVAPDIVITLGGSLTSRKIKSYIRGLKDVRHWSVGLRDHSVDCFKHLEKRIVSDEGAALKSFADSLSKMREEASTFKKTWLIASKDALTHASSYAENVPWSDFKAMHYIISNIPDKWNVQLSNGTCVRYAQLFDYSSAGTVNCNRGVSGIDGCTSTAIGASVVSENPVLLISGDMSMQYDVGALSTPFIPSNFRIVVLNNGGGGIFRFIPSTRNLEELEKYFVADVRLPLKSLSEAYGFKYLSASNYDELSESFKQMKACSDSPVILEVITDGKLSSEILSTFLKS